MSGLRLIPEALGREAFSAFGEVIETAGRPADEINYGQTLRFDNLAEVDVAEQGGRPLISIFRSKPVTLPFRPRVMEYHPLGTQAFVPLHHHPFLVLVAPASEELDSSMIRAFISNGRQGVSYQRRTWHHYQLSLGVECEYLVIDRGGSGDNCVECELKSEVWIGP